MSNIIVRTDDNRSVCLDCAFNNISCNICNKGGADRYYVNLLTMVNPSDIQSLRAIPLSKSPNLFTKCICQEDFIKKYLRTQHSELLFSHRERNSLGAVVGVKYLTSRCASCCKLMVLDKSNQIYCSECLESVITDLMASIELLPMAPRSITTVRKYMNSIDQVSNITLGYMSYIELRILKLIVVIDLHDIWKDGKILLDKVKEQLKESVRSAVYLTNRRETLGLSYQTNIPLHFKGDLPAKTVSLFGIVTPKNAGRIIEASATEYPLVSNGGCSFCNYKLAPPIANRVAYKVNGGECSSCLKADYRLASTDIIGDNYPTKEFIMMIEGGRCTRCGINNIPVINYIHTRCHRIAAIKVKPTWTDIFEQVHLFEFVNDNYVESTSGEMQLAVHCTYCTEQPDTNSSKTESYNSPDEDSRTQDK